MEKPKIEQVTADFTGRGMPEHFAAHEATKFMAYYDSVGWYVGRRPMRVWRGAAAGWFLRWCERQPGWQRHMEQVARDEMRRPTPESTRRAEDELKRLEAFYAREKASRMASH